MILDLLRMLLECYKALGLVLLSFLFAALFVSPLWALAALLLKSADKHVGI